MGKYLWRRIGIFGFCTIFCLFSTVGFSNTMESVKYSSVEHSIVENSDKEFRIDENFYYEEINDELFDKIYGKSFKKDCRVPRSELRYIHVLHVGFDGKDKEGEIIANRRIAKDLLDIFKELYGKRYQIERVKLVDEYGANDEISMQNNNSSCFNYRVIARTNRISKHGLGLAIDINTLYNPYVNNHDGKIIIEPSTAGDYVDRSKDFPHKIDKNDLCYKLFVKKGFEWGGDWDSPKDYQHFEIPSERIKKWYPDY